MKNESDFIFPDKYGKYPSQQQGEGWRYKLNSFRPRFPGDGFNHEMTPSLKADVNCPCGAQYVLNTPRTYIKQIEDGTCFILECPQCASWHTIIWRREAA